MRLTGRLATRGLLMTSFMCELIVVFVSTVMGTMLLANDHEDLTVHMLHDKYEFEYLAIRLGFFQGLLNWLGAIALQFYLPLSSNEEAQMLNVGIASAMAGVIVMLIAFYNHHLTFYSNYPSMIWRLAKIAISRYWLNWPPWPLPILALVPMAFTFVKVVEFAKRFK